MEGHHGHHAVPLLPSLATVAHAVGRGRRANRRKKKPSPVKCVNETASPNTSTRITRPTPTLLHTNETVCEFSNRGSVRPLVPLRPYAPGCRSHPRIRSASCPTRRPSTDRMSKGGNRARGGGWVEERPKRARPALYSDRGGETEAGEPWARPHPALTSSHVSSATAPVTFSPSSTPSPGPQVSGTSPLGRKVYSFRFICWPPDAA